MALIRKKNSPYWWFSFTFAGKRYRQSTRERMKAAAAAVEAAALTELSKGNALPSKAAKTPTLREFSVRFLQWSDNSHALASSSKRFYRYGVRLLLFTRLADRPLDKITPEVVECSQFYRPLVDRKTRTVTSEVVPCSPIYVNQALRTLKAMTGKAVDWEVLRSRPRIHTLKVKGRDRLIDHDTEIKLQSQLEASTTHGRHNRMRRQAWLVMVILQDTGMRPDEVFPMRIENIHWDHSRIWVPAGKTENARRFVGMSQRMVEMLKEWCWGRRSGWVFTSKRSRSGHLESIAKGFQEARRRAGIDRSVVPYSARHTYGTYQMQATGNVFAVSRSMGHADVKSMEPYQHPSIAELNSAINERNRAREKRRLALLSENWHPNWHTTEVVQ
jgi:integrase